MADLTQTPANVAKGSGALVGRGVAGETVTAGQPVYLHTDNTLKLCDADALASSQAKGITTHPAAAGQPLEYQNGGLMNLGATLTVGEWYGISTNSGKIAPLSDLASGDFPCLLGFAGTAALLTVIVKAGGVAKA